MSLREFQRALVDMTLDARLAGRVRREGSAPLAHYELTARELRRLVDVAGQPGMALNCTLARANRFTAIADSYPMTCVLIEPALRELIDELWAHDRPQGYQLTSDVALFAERVAADAALHARFEYLGEVFAYEQACIALVNQTRRVTMAEMRGQVRELAFLHDPGELLRALQVHVAPPPGLPLAAHRMEIELVDGVLESRWFPLEPVDARAAVA